MTVYVVGHRDSIPAGAIVINTTSRSKNWTRGLSPFFVGPVELYDGHVAQNIENAWQFSKAYKMHLDHERNPKDEYFEWAKKGWSDNWAHRYPMGRGAKPEFSYWDGEKLGYIEARKKIYMPLYANAVQKTAAFAQLQKLAAGDKDVYLVDFDAYNHKVMGWSYDQVLNCEAKKMGHAFVLAMLLDGFLEVNKDE